MSGELQIIHGLQSLFQSPALKAFAVFCATNLIYFLVIPVALTGVYRGKKNLRQTAYRAAVSAVIALALSLVLGVFLGRIRPFHVSTEVQLWISPPASVYSFPSSHASLSFAVAFALLYGDVSLGLLALLMATLIAFGRIICGVHYPTDVVAGAALGFLSFAFTKYMLGWMSARRQKKKSIPEASHLS
ncbi:MAG TPA: phosphatase PAP2 family protein [Patescibacteria group bacterium]|nr:phosphatase PAP2 family protein [Patescibacteria group bacterium]